MIRITFAEEAGQDIENIHAYIAEDNLAAADRFRERLKQRWQQLLSKASAGVEFWFCNDYHRRRHYNSQIASWNMNVDGQPTGISDSGRKLIQTFEGLRLKAYRDAAGHATIGYGHLIRRDEQFSEPLSAEQAEELFDKDVSGFVDVVLNSVRVSLEQNQFDALVSLAFNIGGAAFRDSTLLRMLNAGDYAGAAEQFLRWDKATVNGQLTSLPGLARRREAERRLFLSSPETKFV